MSALHSKVIQKAGVYQLEPPSAHGLTITSGSFSVKASVTVTFSHAPNLPIDATTGRDIPIPQGDVQANEAWTLTTSVNAKLTIYWTVSAITAGGGTVPIPPPPSTPPPPPIPPPPPTPTPPPPPPAGHVLAPGNIAYLGAIRVPASNVDTTFAYGGMSGRKVAGNTHLFLYGNPVASGNNPPDVYELDVAGLTPNTTIASAPRATLIKNWGDIYHGKRKAWDGTQLVPLTGLNGLQYGLYWNESLQQLFWGYDYGYVTDARWTVGFSTLDNLSTGASTGYGPFEFASVDGDNHTWLGTRCHFFLAHPTTGKMLSGGVGKGGVAGVSWGPNLYGGTDWPTPATPDGGGPYTQPSRYLNYYYPSNVLVDGSWTGALRSFRYDGVLTYPFEHFAAAFTDNRVDPTKNNGRGSYSQEDNNLGVWWFEGTNRRGVVFFSTFNGSASAVGTDPNATHAYYNNQGQISLVLMSTAGFQIGERVRGQTSKAEMNVASIEIGFGLSGSQNNSLWQIGETLSGSISGAQGVVATVTRLDSVTIQATLTVVIGTFTHGESIRGSQSVAEFTVGTFSGSTLTGVWPASYVNGETLTGLTSGASTTISAVQRHDTCTHGFSLPVSVTGPGTTKSVPCLVIYDPAKLSAVAGGAATDYAQDPDYIIDLESTYGVVTGPQDDTGGAKAIDGHYYDSATGRLYLNAIHADVTTPGIRQTLIHVFQIADV